MPVKLSIEMISPLTEDDRDLLAGLAVMTVAIANREMAQHPVEPEPCGDMETVGTRNDAERQTFTGRICVSDVGHSGRHRYREPELRVGMN